MEEAVGFELWKNAGIIGAFLAFLFLFVRFIYDAVERRQLLCSQLDELKSRVLTLENRINNLMENIQSALEDLKVMLHEQKSDIEWIKRTYDKKRGGAQ